MLSRCDLQRLRLTGKTRVEVEIAGEVAGKKIAPLLLIPFVENVLKYGVSNHEPSAIIITLRAEAHTIVFFSQNTIFPAPRPAERMGVGIANTRQRLTHLYPGKHTPEITRDNQRFTVLLTLAA